MEIKPSTQQRGGGGGGGPRSKNVVIGDVFSYVNMGGRTRNNGLEISIYLCTYSAQVSVMRIKYLVCDCHRFGFLKLEQFA